MTPAAGQAAVVTRLCHRWGVELVDEAPYGEWNVVLPAQRGDVPCMLKLCPPGGNAAAEILALRAWDGNGAVRLLEASPEDGALLLERLRPGRPLAQVALLPAAEIAGALIRRLAIPTPYGLPRLVDAAERIAATLPSRQRALGDPLPGRWVDAAVRLARELATDPGAELVHGDLHYRNILDAGGGCWAAIDPKPVAGNADRGIAELMWTRVEEAADAAAIHELFAVLVAAGELDAERARAWTIVRAVDYWLWALGAGLTEDPVRCHRLLETLSTWRGGRRPSGEQPSAGADDR